MAEVKREHGTNTLALAYEGDGAFLRGLPGVTVVSDSGRFAEMRLREGADPQERPAEAAARLRVSRFEIVEPSLHDIFVSKVSDPESGPTRGRGRPGVSRLWPIVRREYLERVRSKAFLIATLLGPDPHGGLDRRPRPHRPRARASRCTSPSSTRRAA